MSHCCCQLLIVDLELSSIVQFYSRSLKLSFWVVSVESLNFVTSRRSAAAMRGLTEDGGEFHGQIEFQEFLFVVDEYDDPRYWRRC